MEDKNPGNNQWLSSIRKDDSRSVLQKHESQAIIIFSQILYEKFEVTTPVTTTAQLVKWQVSIWLETFLRQ